MFKHVGFQSGINIVVFRVIHILGFCTLRSVASSKHLGALPSPYLAGWLDFFKRIAELIPFI